MNASQKLTSTEILDGIATEIRRELSKNDVFSNDSLCYSGCRFEFGIKVHLSSRGEQELTTSFTRTIGEVPAGEPAVAVEAAGERLAGKAASAPRKPAKKASHANPAAE